MIEVILLSHSQKPLQTIAAAINQCYSKKTGAELQKEIPTEKAKRLLKIVLSSGHLSTIEHASFSFSISRISRVTETQLVRHRLASFSVKSGRYNKTHTDFVIPPKILGNSDAAKIVEKFKTDLNSAIESLREMGFENEDLRFLTPQGTRTNLIWNLVDIQIFVRRLIFAGQLLASENFH